MNFVSCLPHSIPVLRPAWPTVWAQQTLVGRRGRWVGQGCPTDSFFSTHRNRSQYASLQTGSFHCCPFRGNTPSGCPGGNSTVIRAPCLPLPASSLPLPAHPASISILSNSLLFLESTYHKPHPPHTSSEASIVTWGQLPQLLVSPLPVHPPNWPGVRCHSSVSLSTLPMALRTPNLCTMTFNTPASFSCPSPLQTQPEQASSSPEHNLPLRLTVTLLYILPNSSSTWQSPIYASKPSSGVPSSLKLY